MDRRTFLGTVTTATVLARHLSWAADDHKIDKVGVQLYTVRDHMKDDFDGTLAKVASIGYREVEFAGYFDRSPKAVKASLDRAGLAAPSAHFNDSYLGDKWAGVLEDANVIGHKYVVCSSIDEKNRKESGSWHKIADNFSRAGEQAKKAGIQFAYHNHTFEFTPVEGTLPYDILLKECDPQLVKMEMDLYWATKAGAKPLDYFKKYRGRFALVHVKGMDKSGEMASVGADNSINWKAIFAQSSEGGIQHYFVEHDNPKSSFDSIQQSFQYLQKLRF